jgi:hypothetical protein
MTMTGECYSAADDARAAAAAIAASSTAAIAVFVGSITPRVLYRRLARWGDLAATVDHAAWTVASARPLSTHSISAADGATVTLRAHGRWPASLTVKPGATLREDRRRARSGRDVSGP